MSMIHGVLFFVTILSQEIILFLYSYICLNSTKGLIFIFQREIIQNDISISLNTQHFPIRISFDHMKSEKTRPESGGERARAHARNFRFA